MLRFASPVAKRLALTIGALGFSAIGTAAIAQDYGYDQYSADYQTGEQSAGSLAPFFSPTPVKSAKWIAILSANVNYGPSFRGSDKYVYIPYPMVSIRRGGEARRPDIPGDGFDIDLLNNDYVSFGPVGRYQPGRYYSDDRKLFGLRKLPWTIEGGAFAEVWPTYNLRGRVEFRHGFRDEDGWVADLAADFVQPFGQFLFTIGPRATWGSDKTARNTFGITPGEAALNNMVFPQHGLYTYKPQGGFQSAGAAASLGYQITDEWSTTATASYSRLIGDAGKSPIVRRLGDRNQFNISLKAAYAFGVY
ncbi:MipA/OmpV family protein [Pseudochelatococcus sp. G4_1912]|uniref:MipA/OmpV family protein n=1 Tax=Pseudochelatococcus sp. G4_1912 TaxID=3114288 RepID=UPI0039C69B1C